MTYEKKWSAQARSDLAQTATRDKDRIPIRSIVTVLCGNPYHGDSYALNGDMHRREIVTHNDYIVTYAVRPKRILEVTGVRARREESAQQQQPDRAVTGS